MGVAEASLKPSEAARVYQGMDIELGQLWEMYSAVSRRWVPVFVAKVEDGRVTLRYWGLVEFVTRQSRRVSSFNGTWPDGTARACSAYRAVQP